MSTLLITVSLLFSFISLCSAVIVTVSIDGPAIEGQQTRLICTIEKTDPSNDNIPLITWQEVVSGSLAVTIVQYQNGGTVQPPYDDRFSIEGDNAQLILVIDNTNRTDDGTYECLVTVVDDPPSPASDADTLSVAYLDVPSVTDPSSPVLEGSPTTLYCSLPDGFPTPSFSWIKDDVLLDLVNNDRLTGSLNNQNLTIDNVNVNDTGGYRCRAENSEFSGSDGRTSSNVANLEVYYTMITSLEWIEDEVTCRAEGNPTPIVTIEVDSSQVDSGSSSASASVPCGSTSAVECTSDNGENPTVSQTVSVCDDGCKLNPCENDGVCMPSGTDGFHCTCTSGFKGVTCQDDGGSNIGVIVGVVFAVIFVVIIVIVVVFLYRRNKKDEMSETNVGYSSKPADVEVSNDAASREPLKTGPGYEVMPSMNKPGLSMNKDLQKSNEKLFDAREDAKLYDGGKPVGVMI